MIIIKDNYTYEEIKELDTKYNFTPLTSPKMFRSIFTKNSKLLKLFLISLLDLELNPDFTKVKIYNCTLNDNMVILLDDDIYVEIVFRKFDLNSEEKVCEDNSENDKKIRFLKDNRFNLIDSKIYYLFLTNEEISILRTS